MEVNRHGLTLHLIIHPRWPESRCYGVLPVWPATQRQRMNRFIQASSPRALDRSGLDAAAPDVTRLLATCVLR